jgi:tetratricopeptide (TPR) repeat protein
MGITIEDAHKIYQKGIAALAIESYDEAYTYFTKVIELIPDFWTAYFYRATTNSHNQKFFDSIADYTEAIGKYQAYSDPFYGNRFARALLKDAQEYNWTLIENAKATTGLAEIYWYRAMVKDMIKDYQGAIEDNSKAIELRPHFADAYKNRGLANILLGKYQDALDDFTKAIARKNKDAESYGGRGYSKTMLNEYVGAIEDYTRAIILDDDNAFYYKCRAGDRFMLKDYQGAKDDCDSGINLDPDDQDLYILNGNAKLFLGNWQGPVDAISNVSKMMKDDETRTSRDLNHLRKDYLNKIADCSRDIALNPNVSEHYQKRGYLKFQYADYDGAIEDYSRAIELNPGEVRYYNNRATVREARNDNRYAIDDYTKAIGLLTEEVVITSDEGQKIVAQEEAEALNNFRRAAGSVIDEPIRVTLKDPVKNKLWDIWRMKFTSLSKYQDQAMMKFYVTEAYIGRGTVKTKLKDYSSAIEDFTEALQLTPEYIDAYIKRAAAKHEMKDYESAIEDLNQAVEVNPVYALAYQMRGGIYLTLNKKKEALADFVKAKDMGHDISQEDLDKCE